MFVGEDGLYSSRSELIRAAIRDFLIKELEIAKNLPKYEPEEKKIEMPHNTDDDLFVRIPTEKTIGMETVKEYKTYRIIRR